MGRHDLSAFWLYPDWEGPLKQPFWMRPPSIPWEPDEKEATHFGGFPSVPYREFRIDPETGETVTHFTRRYAQ